MRYQRPFPNVIPHAKVGCSRVTHPSATKLSSSKLSNNSVRLECVMHAASVHPEPGSNSRLYCIKITLPSVPILSSFFSSFFYFFCLSSILFQNLTRYFFRTILSSLTSLSKLRFVLLLSLVVQFSMTDFAAFKIYSFVSIPQTLPLCQVLF